MPRRIKLAVVSLIAAVVAGVGIFEFSNRFRPIEDAFRRLAIQCRSWGESRLIDPSYFVSASLTVEQRNRLLEELDIQKRWEAVESEPFDLQIDNRPSWWTPVLEDSKSFESLPEKGSSEANP